MSPTETDRNRCCCKLLWTLIRLFLHQGAACIYRYTQLSTHTISCFVTILWACQDLPNCTRSFKSEKHSLNQLKLQQLIDQSHSYVLKNENLWFQLLQCKYFLVSFLFKKSTEYFWVVDKQDVWGRRLGLLETLINIFWSSNNTSFICCIWWNSRSSTAVSHRHLSSL